MATYKIKPALIIVDLQNCFISPGGSFSKLGYDLATYQKVVPTIQEVYRQAKSLRIPVFFSQAIRERSGIDALYKVHRILPAKRRERIEKLPISIRGTWDADNIDALKPIDDDCIVQKRRDSVFQDTELELWLKAIKVDTLVFTGIDTAICVESSLRDGFNKGFDVILLSDATASMNEGFYSTTLAEVKENFGLVMDSRTLFENLEKIAGNQFLLKTD